MIEVAEVNSKDNSDSRPIKLVYLVGRYPELTTTFIEREIGMLRQLGGVEIQPVSIRYPLTSRAVSPAQQAVREETFYLIPESWLAFDFLGFLLGNLRFMLLRPLVYFGTLLYLLAHDHPDLKARLKTSLHFLQGAYAAHVLRKWDFDHLHAHFIDRAVVVALIVGRLLDKPYSLTAHANSIFSRKILIREKIINARFMVTVSEYNKRYLLDSYPGLYSDKIHILHPWVDLAKLVPPASRPAHERLHILSVGRLVEKKGHAYLVEACHHLQERGVDFQCRVVGSGPLKPELEAMIARYHLEERVHLMGGQPQSEVLRLLETWADVFALPCVVAKDGDRDGIPVSLAEAMAMELPVVSTDIVGISELVQPGTGILVPPHDALALVEALQAVHARPLAVRAEMGRQGRRLVDAKFNLTKGTAQLAHLFQDSLPKNTSA